MLMPRDSEYSTAEREWAVSSDNSKELRILSDE